MCAGVCVCGSTPQCWWITSKFGFISLCAMWTILTHFNEWLERCMFGGKSASWRYTYPMCSHRRLSLNSRMYKHTYIRTCVCVQSSMIVCTHALCLGSRVAASLWCRPRARETLTNLWDSFQSGAESRPQYSIQYIARSNSTKARARDWFIKFSTAMFEDFARAIFVVRPQMSWSFPKQIT